MGLGRHLLYRQDEQRRAVGSYKFHVPMVQTFRDLPLLYGEGD